MSNKYFFSFDDLQQDLITITFLLCQQDCLSGIFFLEMLIHTFFKIMSYPSRPDLSRELRPGPSLNSQEWTNTLWTVGVIEIHKPGRFSFNTFKVLEKKNIEVQAERPVLLSIYLLFRGQIDANQCIWKYFYNYLEALRWWLFFQNVKVFLQHY